MANSNISQILLRNIALLNSKRPLFVNLPAEGFISEFLSVYPSSQTTCFNQYFDLHLLHKKNTLVKSVFAAEYSTEERHDLVVISYPKIKSELAFLMEMLATSLVKGAEVILVGEKNGGIQSSTKVVKDYIEHYQKQDSARHCMLYSGCFIDNDKPFCIDDWFKYYSINIGNIELEIASLPGVFSQSRLDLGTQILLHHLPKQLKGNVLDFACGAGVIAAYVGKKYDNVQLTLVDVSASALLSAEKTLKMNNIEGYVFASNSLSHITQQYQCVISNPPFHQGVKTDYLATETFLGGIKRFIVKKGQLSIVANSFLKYQPILENTFKHVSTVTKERGFSVYHCINE
jgi:16S rRNA (guanine1207-N2)-methyltransferase